MTRADDEEAPRAPTVLAEWTRAAAARLELSAALRARLDRAGERIPYALALEVWQHADAQDADGSFGVRFAEGLAVRDVGVVGYLAASSETVAGAIGRSVRYHALLKDPSEVTAAFFGDDFHVKEMPPAGMTWPAALAEAVLASYVVLVRQLGPRDLTPARVRFVHARAKGPPSHRAIFGSRVEHGADHNELILRGDDARAPLDSRDDTLRALLEPVADEKMRALFGRDPLLRSVTQAIAAALPDGHPDIATTARRMAVSTRTLQRRLRDRGLRYQALVDDVRRQRALALLSEDARSIDEVAFLVGFSDASGFRRAFRRWTGSAPSEARTS